jgi:hypothetical protein
MTKDETLKLALDALEGFIPYLPLKNEAQCNRYDKAITALRLAIDMQNMASKSTYKEQLETKESGWRKRQIMAEDDDDIQDYKKPWVGLTDEEVELYWDWEDFQTGAGRTTIFEMVRDIEAKLRSKNT